MSYDSVLFNAFVLLVLAKMCHGFASCHFLGCINDYRALLALTTLKPIHFQFLTSAKPEINIVHPKQIMSEVKLQVDDSQSQEKAEQVRALCELL